MVSSLTAKEISTEISSDSRSFEGRKNARLLARCLYDDCIHQPFRARLVPGMSEVLALHPLQEEAQGEIQGLLSISISGSGAAVLVLVDKKSQRAQERIGKELVKIFQQHGIQARALSLDVAIDPPTMELSQFCAQ